MLVCSSSGSLSVFVNASSVNVSLLRRRNFNQSLAIDDHDGNVFLN